MSYVYVLQSLKDNKLYIGSTREHLHERIRRHNAGFVESTKDRRPFILIYHEEFDIYSVARKREIYLKTGSGREHLARILAKRAGTQAAKGDRL